MIAPPRPFASGVQDEVRTPRPGVPARRGMPHMSAGAVRGVAAGRTLFRMVAGRPWVERLSVEAVRASAPAVRPAAPGGTISPLASKPGSRDKS
jgi:hypothetical protein